MTKFITVIYLALHFMLQSFWENILQHHRGVLKKLLVNAGFITVNVPTCSTRELYFCGQTFSYIFLFISHIFQNRTCRYNIDSYLYNAAYQSR